MPQTTFRELGLIEQIASVLEKNDYVTPTPIQLHAIPVLLKGKDLLGIAQTGTGKTAAFALPILQKLFETQTTPAPHTARALVLAPTRELVSQIADNCRIYGRNLSMRQATIFGGVSQVPQIKTMLRGVDLLIATPGRLLDLMNQRHVHLKGISFLVLDEADRMLDMGFIKDIKKIIAAVPEKRQTLLFSATMPPAITGLANSILRNPQRVEVTPQVITVEKIEQSVYSVRKNDKRALLITLLQDAAWDKTIVFSKTKHGANRILKELERAHISAGVIHGNKSQGARQKALEDFRNGKLRVLVATDIASRGIDIDNVSHVVNYDLPDEPENYVHRIGRTARAGAGGDAIAFCDETEGRNLRDIERFIKRKLPLTPMPVLMKMAEALPSKPAPQKTQRRFSRGTSERKEAQDKGTGTHEGNRGKRHAQRAKSPGQNYRGGRRGRGG